MKEETNLRLHIPQAPPESNLLFDGERKKANEGAELRSPSSPSSVSASLFCYLKSLNRKWVVPSVCPDSVHVKITFGIMVWSGNDRPTSKYYTRIVNDYEHASSYLSRIYLHHTLFKNPIPLLKLLEIDSNLSVRDYMFMYVYIRFVTC